MPRNQLRSRQELVEQEGRLQLAINALKNGEITSQRQAVAVFNVPRSTLRDRLNGHEFRQEARNHNLRLSKTQEDYLVQWIVSRDERGCPPRLAHVEEMANIILQTESDTPPEPVGGNWVTNFKQRHPELKSRFARRYNHQRAECENPRVIKKWFCDLREICSKKGILPADIYNFDETGFAMGLIATAKVLARSEMPGKPYLIQPGNREWVTTIECINARGWSVPSTIIFKGRVFIEGWYAEHGLPGDWRIELSNNGWTTDEIGLRWLQNCFIPATTPRTIGRYRLLILDGHGSHLTPQFDKLCEDNGIISLCMPAGSSHLLQPLDIGCFGPLKRAYGGLIESRSRLGKHHIDKFDFLEAYPRAYQSVFNEKSIQSSFAAARIEPYDPDRVLSKLHVSLSTPSPPLAASRGSSTFATPHTVRQLHRKTLLLQNSIQRASKALVEDTNSHIEQLRKGFEVALYDKEFLAYENQLLRLESTKERLKRQRSRRQMTPNEGISVQEARDLISRRNEYLNTGDPPPDRSTLESPSAPRRRPPTCSNCNTSGHRRTQCPVPSYL